MLVLAFIIKRHNLCVNCVQNLSLFVYFYHFLSSSRVILMPLINFSLIKIKFLVFWYISIEGMRKLEEVEVCMFYYVNHSCVILFSFSNLCLFNLGLIYSHDSCFLRV